MALDTPRPLLLETIRCEDGAAQNLYWHQKRFDKSRKALWEADDTLDLNQIIHPPSKELLRCRVLYGKTVQTIEYIPYTPKTVQTLKIVFSTIDYMYKYADRAELEALLKAHQDADEIIIVKDGLVADTTISNLAFYDGERWVTPKTPLLEGTMRAKLLDEGFLSPKDIPVDEINRYRQVALINAMIGFKIINPVILSA